MDDDIYLVVLDCARDGLAVATVAQNEAHAAWDGRWYAVRDVIDDDRLLVGVEEPEDHVSPDISRAARHSTVIRFRSDQVGAHNNRRLPLPGERRRDRMHQALHRRSHVEDFFEADPGVPPDIRSDLLVVDRTDHGPEQSCRIAGGN